MANDPDRAFLAGIDHAVSELREQQAIVIAILGQLTDAVEAQTEMLTEILGAARQEPGPSETAQALTALVAAVAQNTEVVTAIGDQLTTLPGAISAELAKALGQAPSEED